jgi:hypothetical protein
MSTWASADFVFQPYDLTAQRVEAPGNDAAGQGSGAGLGGAGTVVANDGIVGSAGHAPAGAAGEAPRASAEPKRKAGRQKRSSILCQVRPDPTLPMRLASQYQGLAGGKSSVLPRFAALRDSMASATAPTIESRPPRRRANPAAALPARARAHPPSPAPRRSPAAASS